MAISMATGKLIALEGIDGSGTTTHAARLARIRWGGHETHLTAEPSDRAIGRLIRSVLEGDTVMNDAALALLFAADRLDHVEQEIEPALNRGAVVITDRYLLSSLAYQAIGCPLAWVAELNREARRPDISILLRVSAETAASRRQARGGGEERFDATESQRRIAEAYEAAVRLPDVGRTEVIDAERDVDTVAFDLRTLVTDLMAVP
ncbi:MAG: dTMP kinase [Myxococcota bacterium]